MAGKTKGIVIGVALVMVLKALMYIFRVTIKALASVIVFLGLYIPLFYCVFGLLLANLFGIDFSVMDINMILLVTGFGLSVICALTISIRNLIVRPASSIFSSLYGEEFPTYHRVKEEYYQRRSMRNSARYYNEQYDNGHSEYENMPAVYYSELEPHLLIYEYWDRFEVFRDDGRQPKIYLRTEYK